MRPHTPLDSPFDRIRPARPGDLDGLLRLLAAAGLMTDGVEGLLELFFLAESEGRAVACGGIEPCGEGSGLVRSVAVEPGLRGLGVGAALVARLVLLGRTCGMTRLYLLTEGAGAWFERLGFTPLPREDAPEAVRRTRQFAALCPASSQLLARDAEAPLPPAIEAAALFDAGYFCAESVLLALSRRMGIDSPLLPAIATGLCSGVARTSGMCGALSGGILALNLAYGRDRAEESLEQNYAQVRRFVDRFRAQAGATQCSELLGCDLGTAQGQARFREAGLVRRCRGLGGLAAGLAGELMD